MYGKGKRLGEDRFQTVHGVDMFFYDADSVQREFGDYGLLEFMDIDESARNKDGKHSLPFIMAICQKSDTKESAAG